MSISYSLSYIWGIWKLILENLILVMFPPFIYFCRPGCEFELVWSRFLLPATNQLPLTDIVQIHNWLQNVWWHLPHFQPKLSITAELIPKASAASLWTFCTHWILSYESYGLTYGWTNQVQTFWVCCGMPRDCPRPRKKLYLFTLTLDTFGGQPCIVCRLTRAVLCHSPLGVCHDPRDTST